MNVLEKILEEIKEAFDENIDDIEDSAGIHHFAIDSFTAWYIARKIIRSHMDDVPDNNDGWIPVSEKLPEDDDMRFYMCIVENHEEDLPMFCQYDSEYGFGFWHDIYDSTSLGFVDTVFKTNDELGYEKVVAWQPLPEPMRKE